MKEDPIIWEIAYIRTFGPIEKPIYVRGLKATIKGLEWHICEVDKRKNKPQHGTYCNDNYYLTNEKRSHLSFHRTIEGAQDFAEEGGHKADPRYIDIRGKK
tara:strand:- start:3774 stop:4076 length:303 start_codon:yes stop_codon:yes gene_type:complete